MKLKGNLVSLS